MNRPLSPLPSYLQLAMANDHAAVANLELGEEARAAVFRVCAVAASVNAPQWVQVCANWGLDLNQRVCVAGGESMPNWLWQALARGKTSQAMDLVRAGFVAIDLDASGKSGLGVLLENTFHDHLERTLSTIEQMQALGLHWTVFPDWVDFDGVMRKNVGASLSELLSARAASHLSSATAAAVATNELHRL